MYAYAHTSLDEETIKLTSFSSGDKVFTFKGGVYGLKRLSNFLTKQISNSLKTKVLLLYILMTFYSNQTPMNMFQLIEQLHIISTKNNLKLAPEKSSFMRLKVKSLDMKLAITPSDLFTQKLQLFTNSLLPLEKLP